MNDILSQPIFDPILGRLIERVDGIYKRSLLEQFGQCTFEYEESVYGAGDAMPCGKDAVGISPEHERPRCEIHLLK